MLCGGRKNGRGGKIRSEGAEALFKFEVQGYTRVSSSPGERQQQPRRHLGGSTILFGTGREDGTGVPASAFRYQLYRLAAMASAICLP